MWRLVSNGAGAALRRRTLTVAPNVGKIRVLGLHRKPSLTTFAGKSFTGALVKHQVRSFRSLIPPASPKFPKQEEDTWYRVLEMLVVRALYVHMLRRCRRNSAFGIEFVFFMLKSQNLKNYLISLAKGKRFDPLFLYTTDQASLAFAETYGPSMVYLTFALVGATITFSLSLYNEFKLQQKIGGLVKTISKSQRSLTANISALSEETDKLRDLQNETSKKQEMISRKQEAQVNKQADDIKALAKEQEKLSEKLANLPWWKWWW